MTDNLNNSNKISWKKLFFIPLLLIICTAIINSFTTKEKPWFFSLFGEGELQSVKQLKQSEEFLFPTSRAYVKFSSIKDGRVYVVYDTLYDETKIIKDDYRDYKKVPFDTPDGKFYLIFDKFDEKSETISVRVTKG